MEDKVREMGLTTLATRLKRISDKLSFSVRSMYKELGIDVEPNWYLVLLTVKENDAVAVMDLAQALGFTHQSVMTMTGKMIKRGYLTSSKDLTDGRRTIFQLTLKAEQIFPDLQSIWNKGEKILTDLVGPHQQMLSALNSFEDKLDDVSFGDRILQQLKNEA